MIMRVKFSMYSHQRRRHTVPSLFSRMVKLHPDKPALIYEARGQVSITITLAEMKLHRVVSCECSPDLELQGSAEEMSRCGSLGAGAGLGRGGCCGLVDGKPASGGGSVAGSGHGWCGGCFHQLQPPTGVPAALHQCVWGSGDRVWSRND